MDSEPEKNCVEKVATALEGSANALRNMNDLYEKCFTLLVVDCEHQDNKDFTGVTDLMIELRKDTISLITKINQAAAKASRLAALPPPDQ